MTDPAPMALVSQPIVQTGLLAVIGVPVTQIFLRGHPAYRLVFQIVLFVALTILLRHNGITPYDVIPSGTPMLRHGLKRHGGKICIELRRRRSFVECRVADNGSPSGETPPGRGLQIVRALAQQLGGELDQYFGPCGSLSILSFPAGSGH